MDKQPRFRATNLELTMKQQGRRGDWLAREIGYTPSYVSHVMKGRRFMDHADAVKVSELLGVPFSVLFVLSDGTDSDTDVAGEAA
jgi:transcriptional regulator with XRE-family HTH domain